MPDEVGETMTVAQVERAIAKLNEAGIPGPYRVHVTRSQKPAVDAAIEAGLIRAEDVEWFDA